MKRCFTLALLLTLSSLTALFAQIRTISGRLKDTDNSPLPGVNIFIKGTTVGTTTDADGYYSLEVPVGSTLVFSFVGMVTREVVVTADNFQAPGAKGASRQNRRKAKPMPSSLFADSAIVPTVGVAVLHDQSPVYYGQVPDPKTIRGIRRIGNRYVIRAADMSDRRTGFELQFSTFIGADRITQLPALQDQYAQGRPQNGTPTWRGADDREIFSWGPLARTLEYDGSFYPFDPRGRLVAAGMGNGTPAQTFNARSLFRTGWTSANELILTLPARRNGTVVFDVENRSRSGVIPNASYDKLNASVNVKNFQWTKKININARAAYNRSAGKLITHGSNLATIIGSVYRTPSTFDNKPYQLEDGSLRTHAPLYADNPYALVNQLPDRDELHRITSMLNLRYMHSGHFDLYAGGDTDTQRGQNIFGLPPGYAGYHRGRLTNRRDEQTAINAFITPTYHRYYNNDLKISLNYQVNYTTRSLHRTDGFIFPDAYNAAAQPALQVTSGNKLSRTSHELSLDANYQVAWLRLHLNDRAYFSNTVRPGSYTNFFPTAGLNMNLKQLLYYYLDPVSVLNLYGSISRTIREAPLLYSNWSYGSTRMQVQDYASFFESAELYFNPALAPETERKFEAGTRFAVFNYALSLEMNYYNNRTSNFVAPQWNGSRYELANVAAIKNYGTNITLGYLNRSWHRNVSWGMDLRWSKYASLVDELYDSNTWVPLAGFSTIQSVLAPGKPVGAIYGTGYLRDAGGRVVIGSDGFPVKDPQLRMLGSPIPDWTLGISPHLRFRQLKLSVVIDCRRGGQMWNGTRAALDYLGRSASTAAARNTANYVFEGVTEQGAVNTTPVSFADPDAPVSQNRWTRYGWDGVGEEHIERASWVRLSETVISYTHRLSNSNFIKEIKVQLTGHNLLLITGYGGVDPSSNLFGYTTGAGLDLFNIPSTRSYSAQLTFKL